MNTPLHVLLVGADDASAARLAGALQAAGYAPVLQRVAASAALPPRPDERRWDLALMDAAAPGANAPAELAALRARALDLPVIVLVARARAAAGLDALTAGANDYVEWEDLRRLAPTIHRELRAAAERQGHRITQAALIASEERFRTVSELSSDAAYTARIELDGSIVIEWATSALTRITGYTPEEVVAPDMWQRTIHPDDLPLLFKRLEDHLTGKPAMIEYRILTRDGSIRYLQDYAFPLWDERQGRVTRITGTVRDVTVRKHAEEALRESERQLAEAQRIAHLGSWARDLHTDTEQWSDEFYRLCGLDPGAVQHSFQAFLERVHPEDRAAVREIVAHSLAAGEAYTYQRRIIRPDGTERILSVRAAMETAAGRPARLYGTAQDVTEQVMAQAALRASEQRFRDLVERAADTVFLHDLQGTILDVNQQACESLGYARDELLWKHVADIGVDLQHDQLQRAWADLASTGPMTIETRHLRKDGSTFPVEVRIGILESQGDQLVLALARDITERKRTEETLRQTAETLEALIEAAPLAIATYDLNWNIIRWNPAAERIFGWRAAEVAGGAPPTIPPDRLAETTELARRLFEGQRVTEFETARQRRDGRRIDISLSAAPLRDAGGNIHSAMAIMADISARKQAEAALRASEQKLRRIFDWSLDGITLVGEDGAIAEWNSGMERITGLAAGDAVGRPLYDVQCEMLPPDQRTPERLEFIRRAIHLVVTTGQLPWGNELHETNIVRGDGLQRTVQEIACAIPGASGYMLVSILRDVTEQHEAAAALRLSEERLWRRAAELQALYDTALRLNAQPEPAELLRLIVDQAATLLEAHAGGLFLYHPELGALKMEVGVGHFREYPVLLLKAEEGLSGKAFARHQSMTIDDYGQWEGHAPEYALNAQLKAMLAVPLEGREQVLGVLTLSGEHAFDEHDIWLAELFAAQAAVALENAALNAQLERRARQLAAINAAGQAVTATLHLPTVLDGVIAEIRALLNARAASVLLHDKTDGALVFAAAVGDEAALLVGRRVPPGAGIAGWVVRERCSAVANDAQNDPRFYKDINAITGVAARSVLAVPLIVHGDLVGVVEAVHPEINAFTVEDQAALEAMAASAAIAIENARLYEAEREQYRRLEQSQAQLVRAEKLAALGRLIASLAHELNNPLQAMQNCMELILEYPLDAAEQREYMLAVQRETQRLTTLCGRVLDFSRPLSFERRPISIAESVHYALTLARTQLEHGGVEVAVALPPDLPPVMASRDRLAQVFLNLIINASEAMPRGGKLSIAGRGADGQVELTFTDTGPGIPLEALPLLFEPLYTTKETGTGLGLPICYNILEQHGGAITAGNAPGGGAVFAVYLPVSTP